MFCISSPSYLLAYSTLNSKLHTEKKYGYNVIDCTNEYFDQGLLRMELELLTKDGPSALNLTRKTSQFVLLIPPIQVLYCLSISYKSFITNFEFKWNFYFWSILQSPFKKSQEQVISLSSYWLVKELISNKDGPLLFVFVVSANIWRYCSRKLPSLLTRFALSLRNTEIVVSTDSLHLLS